MRTEPHVFLTASLHTVKQSSQQLQFALRLIPQLTGLRLHVLWHHPMDFQGPGERPVLCPRARQRAGANGRPPKCCESCLQHRWKPALSPANQGRRFIGQCGATNFCACLQVDKVCPLTLVLQARVAPRSPSSHTRQRERKCPRYAGSIGLRFIFRSARFSGAVHDRNSGRILPDARPHGVWCPPFRVSAACKHAKAWTPNAPGTRFPRRLPSRGGFGASDPPRFGICRPGSDGQERIGKRLAEVEQHSNRGHAPARGVAPSVARPPGIHGPTRFGKPRPETR